MNINNHTHLISLANNETESNNIRLILNKVKPKKLESVANSYYVEDDVFQIIFNMLYDACNKIISQIE